MPRLVTGEFATHLDVGVLEFQAFLDEHPQHVPDHWRSSVFADREEDLPITGLRAAAVEAFLTWMNTRGDVGEHSLHLPTMAQLDGLDIADRTTRVRTVLTKSGDDTYQPWAIVSGIRKAEAQTVARQLAEDVGAFGGPNLARGVKDTIHTISRELSAAMANSVDPVFAIHRDFEPWAATLHDSIEDHFDTLDQWINADPDQVGVWASREHHNLMAATTRVDRRMSKLKDSKNVSLSSSDILRRQWLFARGDLQPLDPNTSRAGTLSPIQIVESWWLSLIVSVPIGTRRDSHHGDENRDTIRHFARLCALVLADLSTRLPPATVIDMPRTRHSLYNQMTRSKHSIALPPEQFWHDIYARLAIFEAHITGQLAPCNGVIIFQSRHGT